MQNIPKFGTLGVIGIRREDKSKWERRVSITPENIAHLLKTYPYLKFIVQPSENRIFRNNEYLRAGAILSEDLSECSTIFGVKEIPISCLLPNRTYVFFSHTIKAQEHNMPTLDVILERKIRLIDYEKITDENNKRLVAFGKFAGNAGAVDFLAGIGKYFLNLGFSTPFLHISSSYTYKNLEKCKGFIEDISGAFQNEGIPKPYAPLIFAITGTGRCADGVFEILKCLPIKVIDPNEIRNLVNDKENPEHYSQIYITFITTKHMVEPKDPNKKFSKEEYYENPDDYKPIFHEKYLPYISVIFHCIYWESKYPKMITAQQIKYLSIRNKLRLFGICDVTCDLEGSIDFLKTYTNIDEPFFLYNPKTGKTSKNVKEASNDILYQAIDHLPTELAYDASSHFAEKLLPFIENIAMSDISKELEFQNLLPEIQRAVIANNGSLTKTFAYIEKLRKSREESNKGAFSKSAPKKEVSLKSLRLFGHLFDTKAVNQIFDYLEELHVMFKVLEIEIGQNTGEESNIYIQILTKDTAIFDKVLKEISHIGENHNLKIENS